MRVVRHNGGEVSDTRAVVADDVRVAEGRWAVGRGGSQNKEVGESTRGTAFLDDLPPCAGEQRTTTS